MWEDRALTFIVVSPQSVSRRQLSMVQCANKCCTQPFVSHPSIVAFDVSILLWTTWLNPLQHDALLFRRGYQLARDVFRAIVTSNSLRFTSPFNDPLKGTDDTQRRQGIVDLNTTSLTIVVIQDVRGYKCPNIRAHFSHHRQLT
jgi:hypothetical protein